MSAASPSARVTIDLADPIDRHRYSCPVGHRSWERTNEHFWCHACSNSGWDRNPEFHALVDRKTREDVPRDHVQFVEPE